MTYFTTEYLNFFRELRVNNNREWFQDNKKLYQNAVDKPFKAFVTDLIDAVHELDPEIKIEPKHAIFRIYRDIRFSKDKTPYKVHRAAAISPQGRKDMDNPGYYLMCNDQYLQVGGGAYNLDKDRLGRIRAAICKAPENFTTLLEADSFKASFGELLGEKNKRLPAEYAEMAEKVPEIFNKQFYFMSEHDPKLLLSDRLLETVIQDYRNAMPMMRFLKKAMHGE